MLCLGAGFLKPLLGHSSDKVITTGQLITSGNGTYCVSATVLDGTGSAGNHVAIPTGYDEQGEQQYQRVAVNHPAGPAVVELSKSSTFIESTDSGKCRGKRPTVVEASEGDEVGPERTGYCASYVRIDRGVAKVMEGSPNMYFWRRLGPDEYVDTSC